MIAWVITRSLCAITSAQIATGYPQALNLPP